MHPLVDVGLTNGTWGNKLRLQLGWVVYLAPAKWGSRMKKWSERRNAADSEPDPTTGLEGPREGPDSRGRVAGP